MKLYRYWARATVDEEGQPTSGVLGFIAVGWSNESVEAAQALALKRAKQFSRWRRDGDDRLQNRYAYSDRPMREPIVEELHRNDQRFAAITRNAYGAYVLNAENAMFADIDLPQRSGGALKAFWDAWRGRKPVDPEPELIERLRELVTTRGLGVRLYRTRAGHRALVTSHTFDPCSNVSAELLTAFGSDPLYIRLCQTQECFRARLSPKPWRVRLPAPSAAMRYPVRDAVAEAALAAWSARYEEVTRDWTTCELITTMGDPAVHPEVQPVLDWHDQLACSPGKPLA